MARPRVVVHTIASVDGRVALAPDVPLMNMYEKWQTIEGPRGDLEVGRWLRSIHKPQVILEGSGSFVSERERPEPIPPFTEDFEALYKDYLPHAIVHRAGHRGWFTAVDSRGRVRWAYKE